MKRRLTHNFKDIVSMDNLLWAWSEFLKGKRSRPDVRHFQFYLMDNILALHGDLRNQTYRHGEYSTFRISDPKPRVIHKASVRDRLVHHALYRKLYLFFDKTFIADSFSCRENKGTHKALARLRQFAYRESKNHTRTCWVLKCDIKQFFASVDHEVLLNILNEYILDKDVYQLCKKIIESFCSTKRGIGLPLGNLTSQLFVNIYMNQFDQFVKHKLKAKHYIRYADDFVFLSYDKNLLERLIPEITDFLKYHLHLTIHKISIQTIASGVDLLGWVHFPDHRVLRTSTKRRMFRNLEADDVGEATVQSYLGLLQHGNMYKTKQKILEYG